MIFKNRILEVKNKTKDYLKPLHPKNYFHVLYKDKTLVIKYFDTIERVNLFNERLDQDRSHYKNNRDYIQHVLNEVLKPMSECDFIIFQIGDTETKFVQFWVGDKRLQLDFPIMAGNGHLPHLKETRKLLEELGFSFHEGTITTMQFTYNQFVPQGTDEYNTLNAEFGKHTDIAAEFVDRVFTDVFKKDTDDLTIILGPHLNTYLETLKKIVAIAKHYWKNRKKKKN